MPTIALRRTKTYLTFDGDADLMSYKTIMGWGSKLPKPMAWTDSHDVTNTLSETVKEPVIRAAKPRLDAATRLLVLVGSPTNRQRKGVLEYEVDYAARNGLPVILIFNGFLAIDEPSQKLWAEQLYPKVPAAIKAREKDLSLLICPFAGDVVLGAIQQYGSTRMPPKGYTWHWRA